MARLESQKKLGYYPTPETVLYSIRQLLEFSDGARCLDTCCGTGQALRYLTFNTNAETFGVELDKERYKIAKENVDNVLNCDALYQTRITNNAFDLLFLNPPYDDDVKEDEIDLNQRLERKFLQYNIRYLNTTGVIIYVIPFKSLKYVYRFFLKYKDLRVLAFPEDEYKVFKQIVIIGKGTRFASPELINSNRNMLKNIINYVDPETAYKSLYTTNNILFTDYKVKYKVETNNVELKTFTSTIIDPDEVIGLIKNSPIYTRLEKKFSVKKIDEIKPLTMLRQGHLAMLLASGIMNGRLKNDKYNFVVKGKVVPYFKKEEIFDFEEEKESYKEIYTKKYEVSINILDLDNKKFFEVK
jgi:16S rRNA G966 N2-methylase RsmD